MLLQVRSGLHIRELLTTGARAHGVVVGAEQVGRLFVSRRIPAWRLRRRAKRPIRRDISRHSASDLHGYDARRHSAKASLVRDCLD